MWMYMRPNSNSPEAYAQLVLQLCDALSSFVVATADPTQEQHIPLVRTNDNSVADRVPDFHPADAIGLRGILVEFGLRSSQVIKLRERWGFPAPINSGRPLLFSRTEIENWAASQPNQNNLAIVLRCRRRIVLSDK
jgi:hypothetical protein